MAELVPTPEQQALIAHDPKQHARVLAGPGTGKSFTLVAFLQRILAHPNPPKVKLLTFTRAATAELGEKVSENSAVGAAKPSTVHSFAISVLLQNPGAAKFPLPLRIADDWEKKKVVAPTLAKQAGFGVDELRDLISKMSANWQSLAKNFNFGVPAADKERFLNVWEKHRRVFGYTLLDELLYALLRALENSGKLEGTDYGLLLVDEYQDLNACGLALLKEFSKRDCTIIGAGDDDQSIYSFRHAAPEGIRRFPTDYPSAKDYQLSRTLRCGKRIIDWANFVIAGGGNRPQRPALSPKDDAPDSETALLRFKRHVSEAEGVAKLARWLIKFQGIEAKDILILLRNDHNGAFSKPIRGELQKYRIECSDPGSVEKLLAENENRRALALLRFIVRREDSLAWGTLLKLESEIGDAFSDYIYQQAVDSRATFAKALLDANNADFPGGPQGSSAKAKKLLERILPWLDANPLPDNPPGGNWNSWLNYIVNTDVPFPPAKGFRKLFADVEEQLKENKQPSLGEILSQLQPLGKDIAQSRSDGVRIMTMTSSKGLTVEAAILVGLEDEIIPHPKGDLDEERRILYVAMTRAKRFLFGTWAERRPKNQRPEPQSAPQISRFLRDGSVNSQDGNAYLKSLGA